MRVIGITGGIGTGKSSVLKILNEQYDAYIVETDKLAHQLMEPGQPIYEHVVSAFGDEILSQDGTIRRDVLGSIVFNDKQKLQQLNCIVHPAVKEFIIHDIEEKRKKQVLYYVVEAALLIEDGYKSICDELWYVYSSKEVRIERLLHGRGKDRERWLRVIENQSSEEFYRQHCDVVLDNNGSVENVSRAIKELLCK